jgi:hypothetical protein
MEHRWGHRHEIARAVRLETRAGVIARGRISNVSISGAFIVSTLPVTVYSYIYIRFTALNGKQRAAQAVESQVIRKNATGFGIEWCEFAPNCVRALVMAPPFHATEPPHFSWELARRHPSKI